MKYVGIFYKIRSKLLLSVLRNIYCAFVYSHILYGIEIYANTSSMHLKKLITLNNKLLHILQNKPHKYRIKNLYRNFDTLAIPELHIYELILVHKFLHHKHLLPTAFADYFTINQDTMVYCCTSMLMIPRYMAHVVLTLPPRYRPLCHNVSTISPAGCSLIVFR